MILADLRSCLAEHGQVSLADMANRLATDPDALGGMLATLERKGQAAPT
jgi:predicted ArsR family transcriptional regulator